MTIGYKIPPQLDEEVAQLEAMIAKFKKGEAQAIELKVQRVPFGGYEQREPDTYMVRIRCAAGIITPVQLESVALIASQYGVGDLHITSRQELQIHYVKLDDLITVIRKLKEIGLATRGGGGNTVRNIAAQEDAGIDPHEEFDVTPYAVALTTRLIAENDSWNLPRKFKIAFSGSADDKGYATIADVGFIARVRDGKKGFAVYAAGGLGGKPAVGKLLVDFIDETQVYPVAKALKNVFWKYGNRRNKHLARLRFLWSSLGEEEFRRCYEEELSKVRQEGFQALALDPVKDAIVNDTFESKESQDPGGFTLWQKRFVHLQKQAGFYSVFIPVEFGFLPCENVIKLARFLKIFGDDVLRMTKDQNFLLRNIPLKALGNVYNLLKENSPLSSHPVIYGKILSCAGASTCQLGICLSRGAAKALIKSLYESGIDLDKIGDIKVNISGCPNSCGHHPAADLGFSGRALRKDGHIYPAYGVYAGALIRQGQTQLAQLVGDVPAKSLPVFVKEFLKSYLTKADHFKDLRDYIAKEGKEDLKRLCERFREVPAFDEDKNYYFDWGADKVFSLVGRGTGECSAGIFDLIEMDLGNIRESKKKLSLAVGEEKARILRDIIFYSSRMLLITRGVEAQTEQEVYASFGKHFIQTGLVEASFADLQALSDNENKVVGLAQAVESLYENMDNGFNFKKTEISVEKPQAPKQVGPRVIKDLRGVQCPMNFVKTKVELSQIKSGEILEVWLDDGAPIENVPGSVKAEGHKIISQNKTGNYWTVVIEKA